jgi:Holliday junction resolvase
MSSFKLPTEKEITKDIRSFLKLRGICHYKQWQGLGSEKGIPDIICIINGIYTAIEVKAPKGKLSEHQIKWQNRIEEAGGKYIVARSVLDVIRELNLES